MLRLLKTALLLGFIAIALAACGRRDNTVTDQGPGAIYEKGRSAMESSNYPSAIQYYKALEARYPFSPETRQAQLDLIYLFYRSQQPEQAIDAAETFEKENPTNARIDYCLYMRGVISFDQAPNVIERLFRVDLSMRPPKDSMKSFSTFQDLIRRFPDSEYVPDARQRMVFLRNRLAKYENYVAAYYIERGAYVAAVNRSKYALEHYPGAPELEHTLQILTSAYEKMGMTDLASDSKRVLAATFGPAAAETVADQ
ncbi:MAG TPA: outer membrane protein assembly factor BamD [Gammaproteobacteria bacterium]|nr:outer membrane protein assembly factor BamD [Gammaproteobacteria bacterium]